MWRKYFVIVLVISSGGWSLEAQQSRAERELVGLKAAIMSADYRGDLVELAALRDRAAQLSDDSRLGYLADYWSGYASWRMVINGAGSKLTADEAKAELARAVTAFESSFRKKSDFADAYASAAAVHGWLAAYSASDPTAMNKQVDIYKQQINRGLELEPNNPRVLWIQAVPYLVMPPERGGNVDKAIELYQKMIDNSRPPDPSSALPDWGKPEALMSMANARLKKTSPEVDLAAVEAADALRLQPEWHYVKDVLIPQIDAMNRIHDFDYLLGDWEFTGTNQQYGKFHGYWSATKLADGEIFDEYRITGDHGETYYLTHTVRAYNAKLKQWDLVSTEKGGGLQNAGTGHRDGGEVRIEQTFGATTPTPSVWHIRYSDIQPDHFHWTGDRSNDNGKTWVTGFQQLEVKRIGPARSLALTSANAMQH